MATFKKYNYNPVLVGIGTYKFRPYTVLSATVPLTTTLTGCTLQTAVNAVNRLGTTSLTFKADATYTLPTSVQVMGATAVSWNYNTGVLVIEKPTLSEVNVKVTATKINYSITTNLTNVTKVSGPTLIAVGGEATLVFAATDNYELPDTVTVTGATPNWTQSTGTLELTNATGNVTVAIAGVYLLKIIPEAEYQFRSEPAVTSTHGQFPFRTNHISGTRIAVDATGITYDLESPLGTTKVYTAATKTWTLPTYKTVVPTEDAHVTEPFYNWWYENILPKLSTPVNLDATDSSVSWDAVENATEYEVVVDNASWGVCEPTVYDYTQDGDTVTIQTAPYTQDGNTVTIT